jgi:hypothetical protein
MFGQLLLPLLPCEGVVGVVVVPVLGVVVDPEFVVVPELELAALAIAAPPPAMIPTAPRVTRAIRSRVHGIHLLSSFRSSCKQRPRA